jgi:hypothetical protein
MDNMRNLVIWNINVKLMKNEALGGDHFDDLVAHIDELISEYESEHTDD